MDGYSLEEIYIALSRMTKIMVIFALVDIAVFFTSKDMKDFSSVATLIAGLFSGGLALIIFGLVNLGVKHPHDCKKKSILGSGIVLSASSVSFTVFRTIKTFADDSGSDNSSEQSTLLAMTIGSVLISLLLSGPIVLIFSKLYFRTESDLAEKSTGLATQV